MKIVTTVSWVTCILLALSVTSLAQNSAPHKFNDAIKRSKSAAELISKIAELSHSGIPKELIDKSEAVAIFPCKKTDVLIEHAILCPGVLSRHLEKGWTLPVFYKFGGGGFGRPDPALDHSIAIILLFMDKESLEWLDKRVSLQDEKQAIAGIVGIMTEAQKSEMLRAHVIAYAYRKDGLRGVNLKGDLLRAIGLDQDNHINHGLYGLKGREVIEGKEIKASTLPAGVSAFQQALQKYYSR